MTAVHDEHCDGERWRTSTCVPHDDRSALLALLASKWSASAIELLDQRGVARFGELQHALQGVTAKMLTRTLRRLQAASLVRRTVYAEVPPRVEYELTDLGRSLAEPLAGVREWAAVNGDKMSLLQDN